MNKIDFLIVTPPEASLGKPIAKTLREMNYQVEIFDDELRWLSNKISFLKEHQVKEINKKLIEKVKKQNPKFVVVMKGKYIWRETITQIAQLGCKTVNFFPEYISHWKSMEHLAPVYNYFIVPCHYVVKYAKEHGHNNFYYQALGVDLSKNMIFPEMSKKYDFAFIGSVNNDYYPERVEFLSVLADLDLHIWGNKGWRETPLKKHYHNRPSDKEMFKIYKQSKIVINIDYHKQPIDGSNIRPFEATACSSLLLNDAVSPEIYRLFETDKEFVPFKNTAELREKAKYYLKNEEERLNIAKAGFERTRRDHTYFDRMEEFIKIVNY